MPPNTPASPTIGGMSSALPDTPGASTSRLRLTSGGSGVRLPPLAEESATIPTTATTPMDMPEPARLSSPPLSPQLHRLQQQGHHRASSFSSVSTLRKNARQRLSNIQPSGSGSPPIPPGLARSQSLDTLETVAVAAPPAAMHSPRPWPLTTSLNRNSSITLSPPALQQQQQQQQQQAPPTSPTEPESRRAARPAPLSPTKAADAREIPAPPLSPTPTLAVGVGARLQDKTHLFLSTQRTQYASRASTARTLRFLLRVAQLAGGLMALTALYVATFDVNYTSTAIGLSGVNLASLTSVTSVVVSLTHLVTLLFPAVVGIVPARERHVSPVELALDGIYAGLWGIAAGMQAAYGSCPRYLFRSAGASSPEYALFEAMSPAEQAKLVNVDCLPWNLCWAFGFGLAALYLMSASLGIKSWRAARVAERREFMFM